MPQVLRIVRALAKFHAAAKTLLKIRGVDLVKQVCLLAFNTTSQYLLFQHFIALAWLIFQPLAMSKRGWLLSSITQMKFSKQETNSIVVTTSLSVSITQTCQECRQARTA